MKGCVNNLYMINGSLFIILGVICYLIVCGILIGIKNKKYVIWWKEIVSFLFVVYICMVVVVILFFLLIGFFFNVENLNCLVNIILFVLIIKDIN